MFEISQFLEHMVKEKASDLFLSTGAPISIKVQGKSSAITKSVLPPGSTRQIAYSILTDDQIKTFEKDLELNIALAISDLGRFRVNVFMQRGEVALVVRYIPPTPTDFSTLNLPSFFKELIMEKQGLILISGATGSGKSTTLAALINHRNENCTGHILTIEDPIEYLHEHKRSIVDQREVGTDTHSFDAALKNAMRESPDVILIGEVREISTMKQAIAYAETGHLCLTSIHATNASETIDRIINFYPQESHHQVRMDLSRNLLAIINQRLVPGIDNKRVPCFEILMASPYIRELIQSGNLEAIRDAMDRHMDSRTISFDESLLNLLEQGLITEEQAILNADSKHNVSVKIRMKNKPKPSDNLSF